MSCSSSRLLVAAAAQRQASWRCDRGRHPGLTGSWGPGASSASAQAHEHQPPRTDLFGHACRLVGLKNVFMKQLPNMPREYVSRLVLDRRHRSVTISQGVCTVLGGGLAPAGLHACSSVNPPHHSMP